jgi:hypothetical protein
MKCFVDLVNVSKIYKVEKVEKFGVQAYVVNLIQLCTGHSSSCGIQPPTNMANPSLESYIYALDDHLQTF